MTVFRSWKRWVPRTGAGYTLIEMMICCAIISILATIATVNIRGIMVKARDRRRLVDIQRMATALESYRLRNGHYPITICPSNTYGYATFDSRNSVYSTTGICDIPGGPVTAPNLAAALGPFIPLVKDPGPVSGDAGYLYTGRNGDDYALLWWRTPENLNNFPKEYWNPGRCTGVDAAGQCIGSSNNIIIREPGANDNVYW